MCASTFLKVLTEKGGLSKSKTVKALLVHIKAKLRLIKGASKVSKLVLLKKWLNNSNILGVKGSQNCFGRNTK